MAPFQSTRLGWLLLVTLAAGAAEASGQWSQFRGPNGSGVDSAAGYPVAFSPTSNVVWKTAMPYGQSSPVVAGGHVYLTASEGERRLTICLDAATGRELWRRHITPTRRQNAFHANDPASPTAAADEDGVIVFFADFGLAAYTSDGKDRWSLPLGPFRSFYGIAASPVLTGDLVVLLCDQRSGSFLIALDRSTGVQRWKRERPHAVEGWATPTVFRPGTGTNDTELVVLGSTRLEAYARETGEPRWWMPLGSSGSMGMPVISGDTLIVSTLGSTEPALPAFDSYLQKLDTNKDRRLSSRELGADKELGEHFGWIDADGDDLITEMEWNTTRDLAVGDWGAIAVRPAGARGKLDASALRWRYQKNLPYIPAPLVYHDVLYLVKTGGIITSLDPTTGRPMKEGRSMAALGEYYASPVAADGKVYLANVEGKITVLKASAHWEILGVNDVGDEIHATPALNGGRLYVRTRGFIYCFGEAKPTSVEFRPPQPTEGFQLPAGVGNKRPRSPRSDVTGVSSRALASPAIKKSLGLSPRRGQSTAWKRGTAAEPFRNLVARPAIKPREKDGRLMLDPRRFWTAEFKRPGAIEPRDP